MELLGEAGGSSSRIESSTKGRASGSSWDDADREETSELTEAPSSSMGRLDCWEEGPEKRFIRHERAARLDRVLPVGGVGCRVVVVC